MKKKWDFCSENVAIIKPSSQSKWSGFSSSQSNKTNKLADFWLNWESGSISKLSHYWLEFPIPEWVSLVWPMRGLLSLILWVISYEQETLMLGKEKRATVYCVGNIPAYAKHTPGIWGIKTDLPAEYEAQYIHPFVGGEFHLKRTTQKWGVTT